MLKSKKLKTLTNTILLVKLIMLFDIIFVIVKLLLLSILVSIASIGVEYMMYKDSTKYKNKNILISLFETLQIFIILKS